MQLRYFGHSAFQLTIGGTDVLVDPFITGNKHVDGVVTPDELNPDVVLLTHAHGDHWGDTPAIVQRSNPLVVANHEIIQYLAREHGHDRAVAMNTGGSWSFEWGVVTQTYARHSSSFPDGSYGGNPNGYIIEAEGKTLYALGDTCPFAEMEWIGRDHEIDIALVPIGDCFTMGLKDSVRAVDMIQAGLTIPVHFNTFPPIEVDTAEWMDLMADAGHPARILSAGETLNI